jgi:hypothetical protein
LFFADHANSAGGVTLAWWRDDAREILYQEPNGRVMAVAVGIESGEGRLVFGEPAFLFEGPRMRAGDSYTSPSPDAQRFLLVKPAEEENLQPLKLVVNWTAELVR